MPPDAATDHRSSSAMKTMRSPRSVGWRRYAVRSLVAFSVDGDAVVVVAFTGASERLWRSMRGLDAGVRELRARLRALQMPHQRGDGVGALRVGRARTRPRHGGVVGVVLQRRRQRADEPQPLVAEQRDLGHRAEAEL